MGASSTRRNKLQRRIIPCHNTGTPRTLTPEERVLAAWQRASECEQQMFERNPEFMKRLREAQERRKQ